MCVPCQMQAGSSKSNSPHSTAAHENAAVTHENHHHQSLVSSHTGYDRLSPVLPPPHQQPDVIRHLLQKRQCVDVNHVPGHVAAQTHPSSRLDRARLKAKAFFDTHWGCVVSASTFLMFFMIVGWVGCYSVLFLSLQDEFGRGATETGKEHSKFSLYVYLHMQPVLS